MRPKISNAEKERLYRLKRDRDPERRAAYLTKKKKNYEDDRKLGRRKSINELTDREKRVQRKAWRKNKRACRARSDRVALTPPMSPMLVQPTQNSQQGRKKVARDRAKCYRENKKLQQMLNLQRRKVEMYRKRYAHLQNMATAANQAGTPSPKTKTKHLLRNWKQNNKFVKRTLTFHYSLLADLKNKYKMSRSERYKHQLCWFFRGKIIKKYKLLKFAEKQLPFSQKRWKSGAGKIEYTRKQHVIPYYAKCYAFYIRDDVSRLATGKKNTITRRKVKRQRRLLTDSLLNLHRKFIAESTLNISYSLFCKLRPFFVVEPTELDRQTCQCKVHENALKDRNIIVTRNLEDIVHSMVCIPESKECMYGECSVCKLNLYPTAIGDNQLSEVCYPQWTLKTVPRSDKSMSNTDAMVRVTTKDEVISTTEKLANDFQDGLPKLKKHIFNIRHQYKIQRHIRENLKPNECMMHVDFSENYSCKYSMRFNQCISVHLTSRPLFTQVYSM